LYSVTACLIPPNVPYLSYLSIVKWQHLECTFFPKTLIDATSIEGFTDLSKEDQELFLARMTASLNEVDEDDIPLGK